MTHSVPDNLTTWVKRKERIVKPEPESAVLSVTDPPDEMRECNVCGDPKPWTDEYFQPHSAAKAGRLLTCKECMKSKSSKGRKLKMETTGIDGKRWCRRCKEPYPLDGPVKYFTGKGKICKNCKSKAMARGRLEFLHGKEGDVVDEKGMVEVVEDVQEKPVSSGVESIVGMIEAEIKAETERHQMKIDQLRQALELLKAV
jgi:hypothetical protein